MHNKSTATAILATSLLGLSVMASSAIAQDFRGSIGIPDTSKAALATVQNQTETLVEPFQVYDDALYSTAGTSLRNQARGGISLSGNGSPPAAAIAAYAYWAVITFGPADPKFQGRLHVKKRAPANSRNVKLRGTVVGTGASPCWPGDTITVYRAEVPLDVVNAGGGHAGEFEVRIKGGAASSILGEDPFVAGLPPPLWEGASLVAVWPSPGTTTSIYDTGLSGSTFLGGSFTYTLDLPFPPAPVQPILWDNIGADGQHGLSRSASASTSGETTTINGVLVAGPGSPYNDSDWNGNDSGPLPSLWDTTGHSFFDPQNLPTLTVEFTAPGDCLTPVANVVAQR